MENLGGNIIFSARKSPKSRTRFAIPIMDTPTPRQYTECSPLAKSLGVNVSPESTGTIASSEAEWEVIQNGMKQMKNLEDEIESIQRDDSDVIRAITFNTPTRRRMSLGAIKEQRAGLEMVKYSMELDDELEYLDVTIQNMEENFKIMFSELTYKRIVTEFEQVHHRKPKSIDYYRVIEQLDLSMYEYTDWSSIIEDAIAEEME